MTEQTQRGTEPGAPEPREPADDAATTESGPVTVRSRPVHQGLEAIPLRAERFLRALDRSRM